MRELQKTDDLKQLIQDKPTVLIQFGRESCTPCGAVRAKIDHWLENHQDIEAVYVDVAQHPAVAAQRGIFSVPSVLVYMGGQLSIEESGYFSLDEIFDKVERYLELQ